MTLVEAIERLAEALEAAGLAHCFGGALALGVWSEPRATSDVDVLVEPEGRWDVLWSALRDAGARFDEEELEAAAEADGYFVVRLGGVRIDVFLPAVPLQEAALARRVRVRLGHMSIWVHDAESLAALKMLFGRPKDLLDVRTLLRVQGERLDARWVRQWLASTVGEDDPAVTRWEALVAEARAEEDGRE